MDGLRLSGSADEGDEHSRRWRIDSYRKPPSTLPQSPPEDPSAEPSSSAEPPSSAGTSSLAGESFAARSTRPPQGDRCSVLLQLTARTRFTDLRGAHHLLSLYSKQPEVIDLINTALCRREFPFPGHRGEFYLSICDSGVLLPAVVRPVLEHSLTIPDQTCFDRLYQTIAHDPVARRAVNDDPVPAIDGILHGVQLITSNPKIAELFTGRRYSEALVVMDRSADPEFDLSILFSLPPAPELDLVAALDTFCQSGFRFISDPSRIDPSFSAAGSGEISAKRLSLVARHSQSALSAAEGCSLVEAVCNAPEPLQPVARTLFDQVLLDQLPASEVVELLDLCRAEGSDLEVIAAVLSQLPHSAPEFGRRLTKAVLLVLRYDVAAFRSYREALLRGDFVAIARRLGGEIPRDAE